MAASPAPSAWPDRPAALSKRRGPAGPAGLGLGLGLGLGSGSDAMKSPDGRVGRAHGSTSAWGRRRQQNNLSPNEKTRGVAPWGDAARGATTFLAFSAAAIVRQCPSRLRPSAAQTHTGGVTFRRAHLRFRRSAPGPLPAFPRRLGREAQPPLYGKAHERPADIGGVGPALAQGVAEALRPST
jgi:hypothetical protein